jgi:F-type H+-transporting ATPase subunit b
MRHKRSIIGAMGAALLLFAVVCAAFASGGEGAEEGSPVMKYVAQIFNFAILIAVLALVLGKTLKAGLKQRTEAIEKTLNEARQARELAEKALRDVEERLKYKDKEFEELISQSLRSGEIEREEIIKEAEKLAAKALEQAKSNIDYELKQAKAAIREEAVGLAMELAEKKIKERLGDKEQKRLFEESLAKLEAGK